MLDILIQNAFVVDGTNTVKFWADVAIEGDRIVDVRRLKGAQAKTVIDAKGRAVAPGFVDMHSHADTALPVLPTVDSLVHQGITSVVVGQCGSTPVPLLDETREIVLASKRADAPLPWDEWSTYASYLDYLRETGTSINVVPLVGQGTVRAAVMGFTASAPTPEQLIRMQAEVARAMDEGAIGMSTGLIYPPGSYATTEEIIEVTRPVGERNGYYFSHIRGEAANLLEAVSEAIRIGRETGASVEIAHFKAAGEPYWPKAAQALELIDQARAEGIDISADMYPYLAGSSGLKSMLPEWAQEGGKEATLERLSDPETRRRMSKDMELVGFFRGADWDKVFISSSPRNRAYEGHYVADLAKDAGKSDHDWVFDALLETELQMGMIHRYGSEDNLRMQLRHPVIMIGTDAHACSVDGLFSDGLPHPRHYGTYPRVLGLYVREQKVITLEVAVRKMTGLPAEKLRWTDRGLVRKGYKADLVVFDPNTVIDRATYEAPHQYPVGIQHVIVNGQIVIRDGEHTRARPGRVLGRE